MGKKKKHRKKALPTIDEPEVIHFKNIDDYISTLQDWQKKGIVDNTDIIDGLGMKLLVFGESMTEKDIDSLISRVEMLGGSPEILADAAMIFYEKGNREKAEILLSRLKHPKYRTMALCNMATVAGRKKDRSAQKKYLDELGTLAKDEYGKIEYASALINVMEEDPQPWLLEKLESLYDGNDEMVEYFIKRAREILNSRRHKI